MKSKVIGSSFVYNPADATFASAFLQTWLCFSIFFSRFLFCQTKFRSFAQIARKKKKMRANFLVSNANRTLNPVFIFTAVQPERRRRCFAIFFACSESFALRFGAKTLPPFECLNCVCAVQTLPLRATAKQRAQHLPMHVRVNARVLNLTTRTNIATNGVAKPTQSLLLLLFCCWCNAMQ